MAGFKQRAKYAVSFTLIFSTEDGVAKYRSERYQDIDLKMAKSDKLNTSVLDHLAGAAVFWPVLAFIALSEHHSVVRFTRTLQIVVLS